MTTLFIVALVLAAYIYFCKTVGFWLFCQAFGIIDNYLQEKHWEKLEKSRESRPKTKVYFYEPLLESEEVCS